MRRVLITGSRHLTNGTPVWDVLDAELDVFGELLVIHGDCPTGADAAADAWAHSTDNVYVDAHPAEWERDCDTNCYHAPRTKNGKPYCPVAGHIRNQKMVDLGADVCLAFPIADSRGTKDCINRAKGAGIPVRIFDQSARPSGQLDLLESWR